MEYRAKDEEVHYSCSNNVMLANMVNGQIIYNKSGIDFYLDLYGKYSGNYFGDDDGKNELLLTVPYSYFTPYVVKGSWLDKVIHNTGIKH